MIIDIRYQDWIRRADLRKNRDAIYVFGDNLQRQGLGGQAREMRGEPNAFGIATKACPGMDGADYFSDGNAEHAATMIKDIGLLFYLHIMGNFPKAIILPRNGIGTGFSELPQRAPRLYRILYDSFAAVSQCPWQRPQNPSAPEPGIPTYYSEGKDAAWFEGLDDKEFAERANKAAMDIADSDFGPIEEHLPICAILSDAADRINRLTGKKP